MAKRAKVRDKDNGYEAFKKRMESAKGMRTKVGVQGDTSKEKVDGEFDLIGLAAVHEFGTTITREGKNGTYTIVIPERSFVRGTVDSKRSEISKFQLKAIRNVLRGKVSSGKGLFLIGEKAQALMQRMIGSDELEANKESTKRRKGSDKPLIDTGRLRQSIRHVEVDAKGREIKKIAK